MTSAGAAPFKRPVVTSTATRGRSGSNDGCPMVLYSHSSNCGRTARHSGWPMSPALDWMTYCRIWPVAGSVFLARMSFPNSKAPWMKWVSVKPRAWRRASRGPSNSRSVRVSRKIPTTSRSKPFPPSSAQDRIDARFLFGRWRVLSQFLHLVGVHDDREVG